MFLPTVVLCLVLLAVCSARSQSALPPPTPRAGQSLDAPRGGEGGSEYAFEFSGLYTWGQVISMLCADGWCRTSLPREFYDLSVPLNVYENSFDDTFKALSVQARADGWSLKKTGSKRPFRVTAELLKDSLVSYISCIDTIVRSVPAGDLSRYRYADSLKCDSRARLRDSLASIVPPVPYVYSVSRYRVSFYVVTSTYLDNIGVDWTKVWAQGDLFHVPELITDWTLRALAAKDTSAEFRSVEVDLDSVTTLHWGSQRKDEKSMVVYQSGVSQTEYEWKDYGLTLTLHRDSLDGIRVDYQLAQRDENNSVLRGKFGGGRDSVESWGVYDSYADHWEGVPFVSSIPFIGRFFSWKSTDKIKSFFVIQVYPVDIEAPVDFKVLDYMKDDDIELFEGEDEDGREKDGSSGSDNEEEG